MYSQTEIGRNLNIKSTDNMHNSLQRSASFSTLVQLSNPSFGNFSPKCHRSVGADLDEKSRKGSLEALTPLKPIEKHLGEVILNFDSPGKRKLSSERSILDSKKQRSGRQTKGGS